MEDHEIIDLFFARNERAVEETEKKYGVPVALINCLELNAEDISSILEMILMQAEMLELKAKLFVLLALLWMLSLIQTRCQQFIMLCMSKQTLQPVTSMRFWKFKRICAVIWLGVLR